MATMIVSSVAPISPSSDFFGLTLGASGRWKYEPPQTEPTRNAAVSKMNVSPMTVTTSAFPSLPPIASVTMR